MIQFLPGMFMEAWKSKEQIYCLLLRYQYKLRCTVNPKGGNKMKKLWNIFNADVQCRNKSSVQCLESKQAPEYFYKDVRFTFGFLVIISWLVLTDLSALKTNLF